MTLSSSVTVLVRDSAGQGNHRILDVRPFAHLYASFGVHCFEQEQGWIFYFTNGWIGVDPTVQLGGVTPTSIEVTIAGRTTTLLERESFAPQQGRVFRVPKPGYTLESMIEHTPLRDEVVPFLPKFRRAWKTKYDDKASRMRIHIANKTPNVDLGLLGHYGSWSPYGEKIGYAHGGNDLDFYPGWHRSPQYAILKHDLSIQRHRKFLIDATTGEPPTYERAVQLGCFESYYSLVCGPGKTTVVKLFYEQIQQYNDLRVPRWVEPKLPWIDDLIGGAYSAPGTDWKSWAGGYDWIDLQHYIRICSDAMAWDDPACRFTEKMLRAEVSYDLNRQKITLIEAAPDRTGSLSLGRAVGWSLTCRPSRELWATCVHQQMPNGAWHRLPFTLRSGLGLAPDPWIDCGMPSSLDVTPMREHAIMIRGMFSDRTVSQRSALKGCDLYLGREYVPVYLGTASLNGAPISKPTVGVGGSDTFNVWSALGRAYFETGAKRYLEQMLKIAAPGENVSHTSPRDMYEALLLNPWKINTSVAIAALEKWKKF